MKRKRKYDLITAEKSKRVIYLKKRGRRRMGMPMGAVILAGLGVLCLLYCLMIGLFMGYGTKFFLVWGVMGLGFLAAGYLVKNSQLLGRIPGQLKMGAGILAAAGILLFLIIEGMILSRFMAAAPDGADYCIILGAQLKENGPSDVLERRLDTAIPYLEANESTIAIVSGGQGANEPKAEAEGMYEYLVAAGIDPSRILLEDQSDNTGTNLKYSGRLLNKEEDTVVVVTSNFHVFRAVLIAGKEGYENVYGLAADSFPGMLPNNMLREFLGIIKDFVVGNL